MPQSTRGGKVAQAAAEPAAADALEINGNAALLSDLPGMAYQCRNDARCTVLFVSEGCRDLFGLEPKRFVGPEAVDYADLVHPDDRAEVRKRIDAALAAQGRFELRYRVRTASGEEKWVSDRGRAVPGASGEFETIVGFVADITELKRAEEKLQEHDDMLSLAFSNARDMMLVARVEQGPIFRVQSVNRRYVDVVRAAGFDVTAEKAIGKTFSELQAMFGFSDEVWESIVQRYRQVVATREARHYDEVTETPRGTFHGQSTIAPILDSAGACRYVLYTSTDMTERKRAEAALRESEERFAKVFRAVPDAVLVTELQTGRIVDVNAGCERIYGFKPEECIGHTTQELGIWHDPRDRERLVEQIARGAGAVRDVDMPGRARDGRRIEARVSCETIELNGTPHLVTIAHDVTAQNQAEQALRESEAKFSTAFRASPGAMSISDMETRVFVEVNEGFCRMLGHTREGLIGRTGVEAGVWSEEADRQRFFERLLADGVVHDLEVKARHRAGHVIVCLVSARVVSLGGRAHLIASLHDMTGRKQAEEAKAALETQLRQAQKLDALGQLAGGIAHDFNNILTGIIAYSELAAMDAERPLEVRKHLATVRKAADRATELVRQILTFSRKHTRERVPLELGPVVKEALKLLRSSLPKTLTFVTRIEANTPRVLGDSTQLHQVVMNLCTNAAQAMRRSPGTLSVILERTQWTAGDGALPAGLQPGCYARLSVSDTGEGMDEATLARIFEPFFTTKAPGEGTGLGLSVVHGIVEDHDGAIFVRSRVGAGTTFEVYLPEHEALPQVAGPDAAAPAMGAGQRILFVDDEAVIAGAAAIILQRFGFKVNAQTDPRAALALFEAMPAAFDLLVTDLTMPQLDGIELARRVRELRPDLPVLLATGHGGAWTPEKLRALGISGLLLKPLSQAKLMKAIAEVLAAPR